MDFVKKCNSWRFRAIYDLCKGFVSIHMKYKNTSKIENPKI